MTVKINGYSSLTGRPATILSLMQAAGLVEEAAAGDDQAERKLRELEQSGIVRISE